jgi:hypothetical protein
MNNIGVAHAACPARLYLLDAYHPVGDEEEFIFPLLRS